ncbi:MAG: hypothetical protein M1823_006027 [Watsoniomyces obsoletus]|nr:MAG: hypothetical protein M1823_006027 [Watsoniomyces obsoletus]
MQFKTLSLTALLSAAATAQNMNLTALLTGAPELSNLTTYVSMFPQLLTTLASASNITILAPSNEAFAKLLASPAGAAIMANDTAAIQAVLSYHVLNGTYPASAIPEMMSAFVPTLLTSPRFTNVTGGQRVGAMRSGSNVNITSGLKAMSMVTRADLNFTGGVVHVIDSVLTVPQNISTTLVASNLTALAGAATAANLVGALESARDLTIFAPSNAAFQNIGSILANASIETLTGVLGYHVVNGTVAYSSTLSNTTVRSLTGQEIRITIANGTVFVNSAKVILADVLVANGVVHVIDNVLNPNNTNATPNPSQTTQSVAFPGASSATGVPFTSGVPTPTSAIATPTGGAGGAGASPSASSTRASGAGSTVQSSGMGIAAILGAGMAWLLV